MEYIITVLDFYAISLKLQKRFDERYTKTRMNSQMVGFLFAPVHTAIAQNEIIPGFDYYFHRFGDYLDLYCIGYTDKKDQAVGAFPDTVSIENNDKTWGFSNIAFNNTRREFEHITSWKFSGEADLLLATARQNNGTAELDFNATLAFDLDKMVKDGAIQSTKRLFEEIARFSEQTISNNPTIDYSDEKSLSTISGSLVESTLKLLPDALSTYFNQGWKKGKHFQIINLSR